MPDLPQPPVETERVTKSEHFYSGALRRIAVFMIVVGALFVAGAWWKFGVRAAAGFALGCVIAYVNFYWLKRVIAGFVDRATSAETSQSGSGIVFRFLLRYVLMAVGAYVILTVSPASLHGLLAGLFLPVAAILCEAAYEVYAALARGI
ncbi:MAG TPA: ATP synthase subunit I [Candidatus Sulfotelmatobacter sp.]|jgi:small-conductance mechanosensitive channel